MKLFLQGLFIIIYLLVFGYNIKSQNVSYYKNISPLNGIASATVYDMLNDSKGYLWFATDNGVSRYDGFEFVNFTTKDGLPLSSTVALHEDNNGRIWFFAYSGALSYYYDNEIHKYKCNSDLEEYFQNSYLSHIYVTREGPLYISPMRGGYFIASDDCEIIVKSNEPLMKNDMDYYLYFKDMGDNIFMTILQGEESDSLKGIDFVNRHPEYFIKIDYANTSFQRHNIRIEDSTHIITYNNKLYLIDKGNLIKTLEYDKPIINLSIDDQKNIWVSTLYGGGVMMYPNLNFDRPPKIYFQGKSVSKVLQDREKNYWFSTIGDGIYFTTSIGFNIFSAGKGGNRNIISFSINGDNLYFSTAEKKLYKCLIQDDEIIKYTELHYPGIMNWIFNILPEDDGSLWLAGTKYTKYDPDGKPIENENSLTAYSFHRSSNGLTYIGRAGLSIYDDNQMLFQETEIFHERIFTIGEDEDKTIWLGTLNGLYTFKDSMVVRANITGLPEVRIYSIDNFRDFLLLGTSSLGVVFIKNDSVYKIIDEESGLTSNMVKSTVTIGDSVIWLAQPDGLNKLAFNKDNLDYENRWISINDGLPTSAIQKIDYNDGVIWLGTERGILSFYPENVNLKLVPPLISIDKLLVNNDEIDLNDTINLEYDQNNIKIFYKGISFRGPDMVRYRYLLLPDIDEIVPTNNRYVDFPGLKAGTYTFFVNAGYRNSIWSQNPARMVIIIKSHFTASLWFILLMLILGLIAIILFIYIVTIYYKRREDKRLRLLRVENRYFRSQLNPHFIFNSLVAIQGFIYKSKKEEAGIYLSKFAKLVRYLMSTNEHEFVTLSRDLVFINNFLNIQQLRFNNKFDYVINIDENIDPEMISIPPMMAQPFIENAIEHGLQHKEDRGFLKIEFTLEDDYLLIVIEDNGVGREKSRQMNIKRDEKGRTHSTVIMNERINLLNKILKRKVTFQIVDLTDEVGKATGTKVLMYYPI